MCCGRCSACYSASLCIVVIVAIYARWVRRWQQWDFCDSGLGYLVEMNAALHAKVAVIVVSGVVVSRIADEEDVVTSVVVRTLSVF